MLAEDNRKGQLRVLHMTDPFRHGHLHDTDRQHIGKVIDVTVIKYAPEVDTYLFSQLDEDKTK